MQTYRVPGPICTDPLDGAFYEAFDRMGWKWNVGGDVVLPDGQIAECGNFIMLSEDGTYTVAERI